jgi:hypothetical protein
MAVRAATARITLVFVATRLLLVAAAVIPWPLDFCTRFEVTRDGAPPHVVDVHWRTGSDGARRYLPGDSPAILDAFARMDSEYYLAIAAFGYARNPDGSLAQHVGFFPGYPAAVRGATHVFNAACGRPGAPLLDDPRVLLLAAFCVSNLALWCAAILLHRLSSRFFDERVAEGGSHWLLCCPVAFFGSAYLAESLFLALSIAAIACAFKRRMVFAAILAAAAAFTRPVGVLLVVPLLLISWQGRAEQRSFARDLVLFALVVPLGAVLVLALHRQSVGDPFAYFAIQSEYGHGGFPDFGGVVDLFRIGGKNSLELTRDAIQVAGLLAAAVALSALVRARAPWPLTIWGVLLVTFVLLSGHLISLPRYLFGTFPVFLGAALVVRSPGATRFALAASVAAQVAGFVVFTRAWPILI